MENYSIDVQFQKRDDDQRLVAGFGYISKSGGELVVDTQGDTIETSVLRDAVHDFTKNRTMGVMHGAGADGEPLCGGEIVEMAVLGGDFSPPGYTGPEGLWIVAKVHDDIAWAMVKDGTFQGFSIGGKGVREQIDG